MGFDYDLLFEKITSAVAGDGAPSVRMRSVIGECARQIPHPDWERLSCLDFDREIEETKHWFRTIISIQTEGRTGAGLWFGLFNPVYEGDQTTADMYLGISPGFDESSIEWAGEFEGLSAANYLRSQVLGTIYSAAYGSRFGLGNDAEYPLVLAYGGILAHTILANSAALELPPTLAGAAVGFDSGDFLFLGKFADSKFQSKVRAG